MVTRFPSAIPIAVAHVGSEDDAELLQDGTVTVASAAAVAWIRAGWARASALRRQDTNTATLSVSRGNVPVAPGGFLQRRHRGPAKLNKQPDGGLLDKLVFGVGVGHGKLLIASRHPCRPMKCSRGFWP